MDGEGIPVGLMGLGEWTREEGLLEWGAHAEIVGADRRRRPGKWVDVIERARVEMQDDGDGGNVVDHQALRNRE